MFASTLSLMFLLSEKEKKFKWLRRTSHSNHVSMLQCHVSTGRRHRSDLASQTVSAFPTAGSDRRAQYESIGFHTLAFWMGQPLTPGELPTVMSSVASSGRDAQRAFSVRPPASMPLIDFTNRSVTFTDRSEPAFQKDLVTRLGKEMPLNDLDRRVLWMLSLTTTSGRNSLAECQKSFSYTVCYACNRRKPRDPVQFRSSLLRATGLSPEWPWYLVLLEDIAV